MRDLSHFGETFFLSWCTLPFPHFYALNFYSNIGSLDQYLATTGATSPNRLGVPGG